MFKGFFNKYVPLGVLPTRMRVEKIVGAVFYGQTKSELKPFCLRNGMSERQYTIFFDVVAEKLGDKITSNDLDTVMKASQEAIIELTEYIDRINP